jgi:uncharacterized protein
MSAVEIPAAPAPLGETAAHLPFCVQFDLTSKLNGRAYRIFVFTPLMAPPPEGYALIVASDGNMTFPIAAVLNGMFGMGGGRKAVVVGVGYPSDNPLELGLKRRRDLTPPTPVSAIPAMPGWPEPKAEDYGGAEDFHRFLTEELRPLIAERWPIDPANQTLYGHSLGGLFTLYALLNHPDSFRTFVASSPSIWWNERAILDDVPAFAARVETGEAQPRVLISVGATEQEPPAIVPPGFTREQMEKTVADARMVDNAAELGARLEALKGAPGYLARYRALDEDDHATSLATSIGRMLGFALRP